MAKSVNAVVLTSARLGEVVAFYRALGLPLEIEQHGDGPEHCACEFGALHFAVYAVESGEPVSSRKYREPGATLVGFEVESLDATFDALKRLGARVIRLPEDVPWGRRAVVEDPDGRPVELNQAR